MSTNAIKTSIPRTGWFATVRNGRDIISAVEPFDGEKRVESSYKVE